MKKASKQWVPEIMYEENSVIPFIEVPDEQDDPKVLFIMINRKTGEYEPGFEGEEVPVYEMNLRQFVDMSVLKSGLTETEYDKVRSILGFEPLREASRKGKNILLNVKEKVENLKK
jgi:hypothetical protein